jgi:hypothetical protein
MRYLDSEGTLRDEAWATSQIGVIDVYRTTPRPAYVLVELQQRMVDLGSDSKTLTVKVLGTDGAPASGVEVVLIPGTVSGDRVFVTTGADGLARFDITGLRYRFAKPGHAPWVTMIKDAHSDAFNSVGWVMAARDDPKVWMDPTFQLDTGAVIPPVEPPVIPPDPIPDPVDPSGVLVFDKTGSRQDWAWFVQHYGPIQIEPANLPGYRLTELWEHAEAAGSPAAFTITVVDAAGFPSRGVAVGRWWAGARPEDFVDLPANLYEWHRRGVWALTRPDGTVEFGMGTGDYYFPPAIGPSQVWIAESSDLLLGLGMLGQTNHYHFDAVFRWFETEPVPTPEPVPDQFDLIMAKLDTIIGLLQAKLAL